jgi:hypothetical protein
MFLRATTRRKNGKVHRYFSVVENRRAAGGVSVQRQVMYLGEINDSQQDAWRKTLEVFDEDRGEFRQVSLFPDDRGVPAGDLDAVTVRLSAMQLRRPRSFGDCWLACGIWDQLELTAFWKPRLADPRAGVSWEKVLQVLAVNRLLDPGSELAVHRHWFAASALDELLGVDFQAVAKDRLYRCLDRLVAHKDELFQFLQERWKTLFDARFDILLYDLTSTYFEGLCAEIPKARHGYSRDGRPDCRQVVIALVVTTEGLPLAYEVLSGNTTDKTTLQDFLAKIETLYGKARRMWVMDRGIPTTATLQQMRREGVAYLVGTPKSLLSKMEQELLEKPWEQVHEGMAVKLLEKEGELYVQARSDQRQKKETAMRRRKLKALVRGLNRLKRRAGIGPKGPPAPAPPAAPAAVTNKSESESKSKSKSKNSKRKQTLSRDQLLKRTAILRQEAGRVAGFILVHEPLPTEPVNRDTFRCTFRRAAWKESLARDGCYLLRAHVPVKDGLPDWPAGMDQQAPLLWQWYMQLTHVEEAFKTLKSDLGVRPIHHQLQPRVEAHILVAFLAYCLSVTLRMKLAAHAPGLSPRAVLEKLHTIQMLDVCLPTTDGRWLIMPRHSEPEPDQQALLAKLQLTLPHQPPPRIKSGKLLLPDPREPTDEQHPKDRKGSDFVVKT